MANGLLYLMRHAATQANRDGVVLGSTDLPALPDALVALNTNCSPLAGRGIHRIFTSPLIRAVDSAAVLARVVDAPCEILPGLTELSAGMFEGRARGEACPFGQPLRRAWTDRPQGGESMADAELRVGHALERIRPALAQGAVAVVGHAVVNRVLLRLFLGWSHQDLLGFVHPHGAVAAISAQGLTWLESGTSSPSRPGVGP